MADDDFASPDDARRMKRGSRASRDDDDGDADRRRSRRDDDDYDDDYDDEFRRRRSKSGLVTAVCIVAIVLGGFAILGGFCGLIGTAIFGGIQQVAAQAAKKDPQAAAMLQQLGLIPTWYIFTAAIVGLVRGIILVVGGSFALKRVNWARWLVLFMAILGVAEAIGGTIASFMLFPGVAQANLGGRFIGPVFSIGLSVGFAVFAFIGLSNARAIKEFTE